MYTWESPQGPLKEPQGTEVSGKQHHHISEDNENFENPYFQELFYSKPTTNQKLKTF